MCRSCVSNLQPSWLLAVSGRHWPSWLLSSSTSRTSTSCTPRSIATRDWPVGKRSEGEANSSRADTPKTEEVPCRHSVRTRELTGVGAEHSEHSEHSAACSWRRPACPKQTRLCSFHRKRTSDCSLGESACMQAYGRYPSLMHIAPQVKMKVCACYTCTILSSVRCGRQLQ